LPPNRDSLPGTKPSLLLLLLLLEMLHQKKKKKHEKEEEEEKEKERCLNHRARWRVSLAD